MADRLLPARPQPPAQMLSPLRFLRQLQANFVSVWPEAAYADPVTHVRIWRRSMFTANTPALARHVLLDNATNYHKSPIAKRLFEPALGQGLLTSDGALWKRHRQMVAPSFVHRRMAGLVPAMVTEAQTVSAAWRRHGGAAFDLGRALSDLTLGIITSTMFGAESRADIGSIAEISDAYQKALRPSLLDFLGAPEWVPRPGMRRARAIARELTTTIHRVIARRRALGEARDDLLAHLLAATDSGTADATEIRDEIATAFTAGHETTATLLGWTLYLLDLHPPIQERLREELRAVLAGGPPTASDIERLRFTRMVIDEALRLYPPAHTITRLALAPDRLGDVTVPAGAVVLVSPWLLHRNPTLWPEPDRFDPDRFDTARMASVGQERSRYSYIPFGAGPRSCLGASFAITEAIVVLATVLQGWRVRLLADQTIEPVALITLRPRVSLRAIAEHLPDSGPF